MSDSVTKLKELLFDREAATLSDLQQRIELVAEAERRSHAEVGERLSRLEADVGQRVAGVEAQVAQQVADVASEIAGRVDAVSQEQQSAKGTIIARLDVLDRRAGTPAAMKASVAEVLDDAIVEARESRHDHMTRAVAPLVIKTIKTELRNSQDEMVEALYPITGRLVKSYVASEIKALTSRINRQLETNALMLSFRSLVSGYSRAELLMADTQQLDVEELYLVQRGSGALIQSWPQGASMSNSDIHMSGVLTAINDFATHAFQTDGGNLRSFELDDATVMLRASPVYLLAAKCRGAAIGSIEQLVDQEFLGIVSALHDLPPDAVQTGAGLPADLLVGLKQRLETGIAERYERLARAGLPFNPLKALATLALLAIVGGAGLYGWTIYERESARATAQATIDGIKELEGYPLQIEAGWRGKKLSIRGIAPSAEAKALALERLHASLPLSEITDGVSALPGASPDARPQIAAVRRQLGVLEADIERRMVQRALDRASGRLQQAMPEFEQLARLPEQGKRGIVDGARNVIASAQRDLDAERKALGAGKEGAAAALDATLRGIATALQRTAAELAALVGEGVPPRPGVVRAAASPDPAEAAEEVGLAAERVATMATAVARASAIRVPEALAPTVLERLRLFASRNAIFFGNVDEFRSVQAADKVLDELAPLIKQTRVLVRVVGYTDDRGPNRNSTVSQQRAEKVVQGLVARGVPRERLSVVGRPNGPDLSAETGPQSPNRRVEFEIGFDGETATP